MPIAGDDRRHAGAPGARAARSRRGCSCRSRSPRRRRRAACAPGSAARPNGCCRRRPRHASARSAPRARRAASPWSSVLPTLPVTPTTRAATARARRGAERGQPGQRLRHAQQRRIGGDARRIAVHHRRGGAARQRVGDEVVPVARVAQRDEQVARRDACGVSIETPVTATSARQRPAGGGAQLRRGPERASCRGARQARAPRRRRRRACVTAGDGLAALMPLAGHGQHVAGAERRQRARRWRPRALAGIDRRRGSRPAPRRGSRPGPRCADCRRSPSRRSASGARRPRPSAGACRGRGRRRRRTARAAARRRDMRAQRRQQPLQRIRRMGVVDIDRGAVGQRARPVPSARARRRDAAAAASTRAAGHARRRRPAPRPSAHCPPGSGRAGAGARRARVPKASSVSACPSGSGAVRQQPHRLAGLADGQQPQAAPRGDGAQRGQRLGVHVGHSPPRRRRAAAACRTAAAWRRDRPPCRRGSPGGRASGW